MRIAVIGQDSTAICGEAVRLLRLGNVQLCGSVGDADALLLLDRSWCEPMPARIAIVRGDAESRVEAEVVISYGLSPRDTLTISSFASNGTALSVQREFQTLDGRQVVIQELKLDWTLTPERTLPVAAIGLITGKIGESIYAASSE